MATTAVATVRKRPGAFTEKAPLRDGGGDSGAEREREGVRVERCVKMATNVRRMRGESRDAAYLQSAPHASPVSVV